MDILPLQGTRTQSRIPRRNSGVECGDPQKFNITVEIDLLLTWAVLLVSTSV